MVDRMNNPLPLGKLPPDLLSRILKQAPRFDPRLILGPGIGLDCAVVELGETCLVFKSDPITFASDEIGWYAVQVNANDIATTGATPRWFLVTALLPEAQTTAEDVERIGRQVFEAWLGGRSGVGIWGPRQTRATRSCRSSRKLTAPPHHQPCKKVFYRVQYEQHPFDNQIDDLLISTLSK